MSSSGLELAVIRRDVPPDLKIMVHIIKEGSFTYDEGHFVDDEGHFPHPGDRGGLRWIHVPTNNMAHVAVSQSFCCVDSVEDLWYQFLFDPRHVSPSVTASSSSIPASRR
jgi:hypothetical protein